MIKTTLNWTVKNLKSMNDDKHTLDFQHPIQRQSGQWDGEKLKKSLLIHSMLAGYPVPPIYCLKEAVDEKNYSYSILDGKQRLTTIFDYINGNYPLDDETPSVTMDDVTYELGGKYFTDLDLECQQEILRFKFTIYGFEDADDDLIEEIFFRLNNSAPLSKPQKSMALTGVRNAAFVKSLLSDKFFSEICQFSALQRRKSDDLCTLLQAMMLLDSRYYEYGYASISAEETMKYAASIKNNYSEKQKEKLFDIVDYLEKVFPHKEKMLKKINIPMLFLVADTAMGDEYDSIKNIYRVGPMYFRQWFYYFFEECYEDYKQYCSSGSIKKEKTLKRIEIMENSFVEYFELADSADEKQDEENISNGESALEENNLLDDNSPSLEKEVLSDEPDLSDNSMPSADIDSGSEHSQNKPENADLQGEAEPAFAAEDVSFGQADITEDEPPLQEESPENKETE